MSYCDYCDGTGSLPDADHPCEECGGLGERRRADLLSGWWYLRPGESMDEHAARLKADPRWQQ